MTEWVLALTPTVLLVGYWIIADRVGRITLLEDDAFYYFGVARSIAEGHGSTFAGAISTNGYHPLWLLILVPVTFVVQDAELLVLAVVLVHGVLWALSVKEAFRIGDAIGAWRAVPLAVTAYATIAVMTGHLAFNGMESAPVMYLFLLLVRMALVGGPDRRPRQDLGLGIVLALICLTRLDAAFGAAAVGLVLLVTGGVRGRRLVRRALVLAAPTALGLAVYMLVNQSLFGTPMPVSGQAKALGATGGNTEQFWGYLETGELSGRKLWLGVVGLVIVGLAAATRPWRERRARGQLLAIAFALVAGQAILVAYQVHSTSFVRPFSWYNYQLALFMFAGALLFGAWVLEHVASAGRVMVVAAVALFVGGTGAEVAVKRTEAKRDAAILAADWVDANLPPDAVVAMGDRAGYFGYIAERPLLHLEGLVADLDFLHALEDGEAPERLNDEGVDYYIHNARPGIRVDIDGKPCWRFLEPPYTDGPKMEVTVCLEDLAFMARDEAGGKGLSVWRYRPELNR